MSWRGAELLRPKWESFLHEGPAVVVFVFVFIFVFVGRPRRCLYIQSRVLGSTLGFLNRTIRAFVQALQFSLLLKHRKHVVACRHSGSLIPIRTKAKMSTRASAKPCPPCPITGNSLNLATSQMTSPCTHRSVASSFGTSQARASFSLATQLLVCSR